MKKVLVQLAFVVFMIFVTACNTGETRQETDPARDPAATDTMPTLQPRSLDSSGTLQTPLTGDENVIMPDSAIKSE